MEITYVKDTGTRHEWVCRHADKKYFVSYHYVNDAWSVQRCRDDGEREILSTEEANDVLDHFSMEEALDMAKSEIRGPSVYARRKAAQAH